MVVWTEVGAVGWILWWCGLKWGPLAGFCDSVDRSRDRWLDFMVVWTEVETVA